MIDSEHLRGEIVYLRHAHVGGHLCHAVVDQGEQRGRISLLHQFIIDAVQYAPLALGTPEVIVQASVSRMGERLRTGQCDGSCLDIRHACLAVILSLLLGQVDFDAAQLIDDVDKAVKADRDIILYIKAKLLVERIDRKSYSSVRHGMPQTAHAVAVNLDK